MKQFTWTVTIEVDDDDLIEADVYNACCEAHDYLNECMPTTGFVVPA